MVYETNPHWLTLTTKLQTLVANRGITQAELADRLKIPRAAVAKILTGHSRISQERLDDVIAAIGDLTDDEKTELLRAHHHAAGEDRSQRKQRDQLREYAYIESGDRIIVGSGNVVAAGDAFRSGEDDADTVRAFYLANLEEELAVVTKHAKRRLIAYRTLRFVALIASAITPAVALLNAAPRATAAIAGLAFLSEGSIQLTRVNDRAVLDTRRANALNREHRLYRTKVGDYATAENPFALLVKRVEAIREESENEQLAVVQQSFGTTKAADKS